MEPEVQAKPRKRSKRSVLLISLLIFSLLMVAAAAQLTYMTLKNDRVYKGIYINSLDVGGMSKSELTAQLNQEFQDRVNGVEIELKTDRVSVKSSLTALNVKYNVAASVDKAYAIGRTGNIFERLGDIITAGSGKTVVEMPISYDNSKLNEFIDDFYSKTLITVKEAETLIQNDKVILRSGSHGENIDKAAILSMVDDKIKNCSGGTINAEVIKTPPSKLNVDDLYTEVNKDPQDATFKVENDNVTVVPHVVGRKIEKITLVAIAAQLDGTENTEKVLPVEITMPKLTTDAANAGLFKNVLGTMSTYFSMANDNGKSRGANIRLAAAKINGKILAPGEVFSFNGTVGPRTESGGYQTAHTYVAGKVVDGIGGGICQVSSTLYNAVLKADLGIVERRNHMFTVGYVPYGQDATVSFGTTDFRFKNTTNWPIKISANVSKNNNIAFTLTGTNDTPDKKVIISNQTIKTIPFTTKYIDDPTLAEGKTSVRQEGENGYVIDTFKTVKVGANVISQGKLYTSTYTPLVKEVLKGTKKASTATPPASTTQPGQPAQPVTGVDDADNPPAPLNNNADSANNPPAAQ
jgi:vancomycin resistance protein YoaR